MLDWRVSVDTPAGPETFSGKAAAEGQTRVVCQLPRGVLRSVRAVMALDMAEDEKVFMNGYQTWTYCPERGKWDRQRGLNGAPADLVKKFGSDRYGDYHFAEYPDRPGVSHGYSWCYFRRGDRFRLIGSLDERAGYTVFRYDAQKGQLTIERDCAGVACEGPFAAFELYFAQGTEAEVFDGWFAAMGLPAPDAPPIKGYSSWYDRYEDISAGSIRSALDGCRGLLEPGDLFQVDDGWEPAVGDWLEPDGAKFPGSRRGCGWPPSCAAPAPRCCVSTRTGCCRWTAGPGTWAPTGAAFTRWTSTRPACRTICAGCSTGCCTSGASIW